MGKFEASIADAAAVHRTRRCWKTAVRFMPNSARRAIARTAAVWSARTSRTITGFTAATIADTVKVIWDGVPAKGMITWKTVLKPDEIQAVASYIYTLRGAKLATPGKPPENQAPAKPAGPSQFE